MAHRDCQHCLVTLYDDETGKVELDRQGLPLLRILDQGTEFLAPCRDTRRLPDGSRIRSCPKGTPENPKTLWPENEECFEHYIECQAVNQWPDDAVVRRNAAALKEIEALYERSQQLQLQVQLATLNAMK